MTTDGERKRQLLRAVASSSLGVATAYWRLHRSRGYVFVAAVLSLEGASREVLRRCLLGQCEPLMGQALFVEHEAVLSRAGLFEGSVISEEERRTLWAAFASRCRWVRVYYLWRPNLPDESDNHVIELAVAGGADAIVTHNKRDFDRMELRFPGLRVVTPGELIVEA